MNIEIPAEGSGGVQQNESLASVILLTLPLHPCRSTCCRERGVQQNERTLADGQVGGDGAKRLLPGRYSIEVGSVETRLSF